MKTFLIAFVIALVACAPKEPTKMTVDNTAQAVLIEIGDSPTVIEFVSTDGKLAFKDPAKCWAEPECKALVYALQAAGKGLKLILQSDASQSSGAI